MKQTGQVEILRARVYPQDPERPHGPEVIVKKGRYPLYSDGNDTFWVMRGRINAPAVVAMGGGMFAVRNGDWPTGGEVEFPSKRFGPDEWADLLASPEFTEGHEAQRLRVLPAAAEADPRSVLDQPAVAYDERRPQPARRFAMSGLPGSITGARNSKPKKGAPENVGHCAVCKEGVFTNQEYGRAPRPLLGKAHGRCGGVPDVC